MDGSEITGGPVTHDTQVSMTINNHEEKIRLHCITIGNAPVILGLPWLKLHNPAIDWRAHRLSFHSDKCAEQCLITSPRATTVAEERATEQYYQKTPEEPGERAMDPWEICHTVMEKIEETEKETSKTNEEIIPKEYQDFLGVFTSKEATKPPAHRQQDHRDPAATRHDAAIRATTPAERRKDAGAKRIHRHQREARLDPRINVTGRRAYSFCQ